MYDTRSGVRGGGGRRGPGYEKFIVIIYNNHVIIYRVHTHIARYAYGQYTIE